MSRRSDPGIRIVLLGMTAVRTAQTEYLSVAVSMEYDGPLLMGLMGLLGRPIWFIHVKNTTQGTLLAVTFCE